MSLDGRMPDAIRSTLQGAEALSVGLVHAVTETVVTAVRGVQQVGAEIGTTAVSAVRGSNARSALPRSPMGKKSGLTSIHMYLVPRRQAAMYY